MKKIVFLVTILLLVGTAWGAYRWRWETGQEPDILNQYMSNPEFRLMTVIGNTDLGDAATDTLTITGKVDSDLILDDDTTDSPSLILRDAGEATCTILKANGANANTTVTTSSATASLQVLTGCFMVGNQTPTVTLNAEDAYVEGTFEVDGACRFDNSSITLRAIAYTLPADNGDAGEQLQTDGAGTLSWEAAGSGSPTGSDTQMQYNNNGSWGAISSFIYDDTNIELADDFSIAWGTDANWTSNFDNSVDGQLLWLTADDTEFKGAVTDPMYEIIVGASPTADQQVFGLAKGTQSSNTALFTVDEDGDVAVTNDLTVGNDLTVTGTQYMANLAAAPSGSTNLTINAGLLGNGTITLGNSSTGKITTDNLVECQGNVDIGDAVASDTLSITAKIDTDVYIDDDSTDSPRLIFRDTGEATCTILKVNGATANTTITTSSADAEVQVLTGNFKVGNQTESTTMDGEDAYIEGTLEVDGALDFDGAADFASTVAIAGAATIGEVVGSDQIAITFNANDEELAITGTATNMTAAAMQTITMAAQDSTKHILRLIQTPDADAENEFLLLEDNAGDDKFEIEEGGTTTWTLDAASIVKVDADTTANTSTGGAVDVDFQTNTNNGAAMTITVQQENSATQAFGLLIDLNDDCDDDTFDAIHVKNAAGTNSTTRALVVANNIDDAVVVTCGAASNALVIDAAATINTTTAGVIDCTTILSESGASFVNIDVESEADGASELVHGIYVSMDDDADNADNEVRGLTVAGDGTDGTGLQHAIVTSGANIDAGLYLQTGYLRVGTGTGATESLGDDDGFLEGTLEVDGVVYADAGVEIDNTLLMTATVELSNANVEALQGTPIELVAAPGAGFLLEFVSAILILDYAGDTLTETDDNLAIEYDNGSAAAVSETIEMTGFIDQGSDQITRAIPIKDAMDAALDIVNKNLAILNTGNGEFVDGGSDATSTMTVIITYRMHNVLGL